MKMGVSTPRTRSGNGWEAVRAAPGSVTACEHRVGVEPRPQLPPDLLPPEPHGVADYFLVEHHQLRNDRRVTHERLGARGERRLVVRERMPLATAQPFANRLHTRGEERARIVRRSGPLQDRIGRTPHDPAGRRGASSGTAAEQSPEYTAMSDRHTSHIFHLAWLIETTNASSSNSTGKRVPARVRK